MMVTPTTYIRQLGQLCPIIANDFGIDNIDTYAKLNPDDFYVSNSKKTKKQLELRNALEYYIVLKEFPDYPQLIDPRRLIPLARKLGLFTKRNNMFGRLREAVAEWYKEKLTPLGIFKHRSPCWTFVGSPREYWSHQDVAKFLRIELPKPSELDKKAQDPSTPAGFIREIIWNQCYHWDMINSRVRFNLDVYHALLKTGGLPASRILKDLPILVNKGLHKDEQLILDLQAILKDNVSVPISRYISSQRAELPEELKTKLAKFSPLPPTAKNINDLLICIESPMSKHSAMKSLALMSVLCRGSDSKIIVKINHQDVTRELQGTKSFTDVCTMFLPLIQEGKPKKRIIDNNNIAVYITEVSKPIPKKSIEVLPRLSVPSHIKKDAANRKQIIGINDRIVPVILNWTRK